MVRLTPALPGWGDFVMRVFLIAAVCWAALAGDASAQTRYKCIGQSDVTGGKAVWCTDGMAGGLLQIARRANDLTHTLPAEYRICLDDRLTEGRKVTVFHGKGLGAPERTTLDAKNRCGCFLAPHILVQNNSDAPGPQQDDLGGTFEAFAPGGRCNDEKRKLVIGPAFSVDAQCRAEKGGTGSSCPVVLPGGSPGKQRSYRLCFADRFVDDRNAVIRLRINGYSPPPKEDHYDPRGNLITTSCYDIFDYKHARIQLSSAPQVNKSVRMTLRPIRLPGGK
jgi:hypothetical protein